MYEIRKSIGGWSLDKKVNGQWMFYAKFSSKKACIKYIENKQNEQKTLF